MPSVILHRPLIPPNTGNVIRLCANTGCPLHLVRPLGFELSEPRLRRAGLDYASLASVSVHDSLDEALAAAGGGALRALSTSGGAPMHRANFTADDVLLFGNEEAGLPEEVKRGVAPGNLLRIPMQPGSRSLNLSNAVAVAVYFALDRCGALDGLAAGAAV